MICELIPPSFHVHLFSFHLFFVVRPNLFLFPSFSQLAKPTKFLAAIFIFHSVNLLPFNQQFPSHILKSAFNTISIPSSLHFHFIFSPALFFFLSSFNCFSSFYHLFIPIFDLINRNAPFIMEKQTIHRIKNPKIE